MRSEKWCRVYPALDEESGDNTGCDTYAESEGEALYGPNEYFGK
ncbi:hypothetical protein AGR6A_Cc80156 [Agrobacterium sp. NCPPB 925]|nr:hypothetical protein AGR6A_Cc80156 [Agrobacterium sp. NCPPB 925]